MVAAIVLKLGVLFFDEWAGVRAEANEAIWELGCWGVGAAAESETACSDVEIGGGGGLGD
jgi:hypothetical protein